MEVQINNRVKHFKFSPELITGTITLLEKMTEEGSYGLVDLVFVDPVEMRTLNNKYFKRKEPTDVISLEYEKNEKCSDSITGEIFICPHVALKNAREAGCLFKEELVRLVVHGCLHSMGMEHTAYFNESPMYRLQEQVVRQVRKSPSFDSYVAELYGIG